MSVKSRGLGKGLDILLKGNSGKNAPKEVDIREIPIADIFPNPLQPRQRFTEKGLDDLAQSIRTQGILQPILVRPRPRKSSGYEIVAGERRWRAARRADLQSIPTLVRDIDDKEALAIALIENLQREDLDPIEEAMGLLRVKDAMGLSQQELAKKVGRSRPAIANSLRLLQLPSEIQEDLKAKKITAGHARTYLALEDTEAKIKAHAQVIAKQLNVRQTEMLIRQIALAATQKNPDAEKEKKDTIHFRKQCKIDFENILGKRKGLILRVSGGPNKGAITFSYATSDERERVFRIMQHGVSQKIEEK